MPTQIVHLDPREISDLFTTLEWADKEGYRVRLVVQDGGIKIAVGPGSWSFPLGTVEERP